MQLNDLSFDPNDPWFPVPGKPGWEWAVQVFTLTNLYGASQAASVAVTDDAVSVHADELTWGAGAFTAAGTIDANVTVDASGELVWRIRTTSEEAIKSAKLMLRGLPDAPLARGWWHATSDVDSALTPANGTPVQLDYPNGSEWLTPWVATGNDDHAITVSVRDEFVRAKRFFAHTPPWSRHTIVEVVCEADAQDYRSSYESPPIVVRETRTAEELAHAFDSHIGFVENAFGLAPWSTRSDVPEWLRSIRIVLNLHGQHWTGKIFNTYDDMADILRFAAQTIPGEEAIAFLPGWEGRYYWQYPYFSPAKALGGDAGFGRLADTARDLGIHLMPMFGAHGANAQIYPEWKDATFLNATGRYPVFVGNPDWDGDRAGEGDLVFLNTGHPGFRRFLIEQVSAMVDRYGIDIVYFDTTGVWFNDPRYNLLEGYRELKHELAQRYPGLAIAGEGWTDALLAVFPLNLSWLGISRRFRRQDLLSRYGRAFQHLCEGAPGNGSTGVYEGGFAARDRSPVSPGHIPSISFVDGTIRDQGDEVTRVLRQAHEADFK
jgi:hypothetical protein